MGGIWRSFGGSRGGFAVSDPRNRKRWRGGRGESISFLESAFPALARAGMRF
jgi:hypothetical protein